MDPRVKLRQLREQRFDTHERMQRIHEKAGGRALHPDEQQRWDDLDATATRLDGEIERLRQELETSPSESEERQRQLRAAALPDTPPDSRETGRVPLLGREERIAHRVAGGRDIDAWEDGELRLGAAIRGLATGRWDGAEAEQRALSSTTLAGGGALVPEPLAAMVIDRARNSARVIEAGAQTVVMTSETLKIPRLVDDPQGVWRDQNEPVAEDDLVFDQAKLEAKTLAVLVKLPWELGQDMTPEGAAIIERALVTSLALELDRVALRGSGQEATVNVGADQITGTEPLGVRFQDGVTVQSLGVNGASLDAARYAVLLDAVGAILDRNHTPNAQIYSARTAREVAGWTDTTGQPLQAPPLLSNVRQLPTNQIRNDLTQGTSNDTSEIYTADWSQMIIGFRPTLGVQLIKLDQTFAKNMQTGLLAYLRADVALAHAGAFAVTTGVRP